MPKSPHLFIALSGHGFGHLAQSAPVINKLRQHLPKLRLTIQCDLPAATLRRRIIGDFQLIPNACDFGMVMANAMDVLVEDSLAAYQAFHNDWDSHLARQIALLEPLAPDLVLANIPYLPLAAAAQLHLPAVALCSLNWADILQGYCQDSPDWQPLRQVMLDAYNSAAEFLCPTPSMPMPDINNIRPIGPIATRGEPRRAEINGRLGLTGNEIVVLVSLGGIASRLPLEHWPPVADVRWLVPAAWGVERPDIVYHEALADLPYTDLLCSCDVLLTKPGYGSLTEAVCNGIPVLYVERGDWPEEPWLVRWLSRYGNALRIDRDSLETGNLHGPLRDVRAQPPKPALYPYGVYQAATRLQRYLDI